MSIRRSLWGSLAALMVSKVANLSTAEVFVTRIVCAGGFLVAAKRCRFRHC